jgi:hypothetical protein
MLGELSINERGMANEVRDEIAVLEQEYATALHAIQQQRLVVAKLERVLRGTVPATALVCDATTQTELASAGPGSSAGALNGVVKLRVQIVRERERRAIAEAYYARQAHELEAALEALRHVPSGKTPPPSAFESLMGTLTVSRPITVQSQSQQSQHSVRSGKSQASFKTASEASYQLGTPPSGLVDEY